MDPRHDRGHSPSVESPNLYLNDSTTHTSHYEPRSDFPPSERVSLQPAALVRERSPACPGGLEASTGAGTDRVGRIADGYPATRSSTASLIALRSAEWRCEPSPSRASRCMSIRQAGHLHLRVTKSTWCWTGPEPNSRTAHRCWRRCTARIDSPASRRHGRTQLRLPLRARTDDQPVSHRGCSAFRAPAWAKAAKLDRRSSAGGSRSEHQHCGPRPRPRRRRGRPPLPTGELLARLGLRGQRDLLHHLFLPVPARRRPAGVSVILELCVVVPRSLATRRAC